MSRRFLLTLMTLLLASATVTSHAGLTDEVSHHYVDNNGVKIHYVKAGSGPLVVMVHGFPDYWYSWRYQMNGLKKTSPWLRWINAAITAAISPTA